MDHDFITQEYQEIDGLETTPKRSSSYKAKPQKPLWREYIEVIGLSLLAAILLRVFIVSAYRVDSNSMEETLMEGDYIFVNQMAYSFEKPQPGDVVVFKYPLNPTKDYIKRIIAIPGQTVEVVDKVIYIDNQLAEMQPNVKNSDPKVLPAQLSTRDNFGPVEVPEGQYFVMGDNRDISQDSRFWGMLPEANIKGKAIFVYWSWIPDQDVPHWNAPYIHSPFVFLYYFLTNFPSQTRWERLFTAL